MNKDLILHFTLADDVQSLPKKQGFNTHSSSSGRQMSSTNAAPPHTSFFHLTFISKMTSYVMEYPFDQFGSPKILPIPQPTVGVKCWKSTALMLGSAAAKNIGVLSTSSTSLQNTALWKMLWGVLTTAQPNPVHNFSSNAVALTYSQLLL